jgi:hypothetical protein
MTVASSSGITSATNTSRTTPPRKLRSARAIRSAIGKIRTHDSAAAAHLDQAVRTGTYCSYTA